MTFTEIVTEVTSDLNLTSSTATTRVGRKVNIRYREVMSSLGLLRSRRGSNTQASVAGTNLITFTGLNKVTRVLNLTAGSGVTATKEELEQVEWDEIEEMTIPSSDSPTKWAVKTAGSITVIVAFDVAFTGTSVSLRADGYATLSDLSGATEPAFPNDFHDALVWLVKADEYMKMEKMSDLAKYCEMKGNARVSACRLHMALNLYKDNRQAGNESLGK